MSNKPRQFKAGRRTQGPSWWRRRNAGRRLLQTERQRINWRRRAEHEAADQAGTSRKRWLRSQRRLRNSILGGD